MKNNKFIILLLALITISIGFTGCATIMSGTTQLVTISCNVDGADIALDGQFIGKTPFTGEIDKNGEILVVSKSGYKPFNIALSTSIDAMFWGNIITGGTLGSITDFSSGAAYEYSPSNFYVELVAEGVSLIEQQKNFEIKKFAMMNMSDIAVDIANGSGLYLESLIHLAGLESSENSIAVIAEKLTKSNGDQLVFGQLITE